MKTRQGFVSNSSSSSFIICKNNGMLSEKQIQKIFDFVRDIKESDEYGASSYSISTNDSIIFVRNSEIYGEEFYNFLEKEFGTEYVKKHVLMDY